MNNIYISTIKQIVTRIPAVVPHLKGRAWWVIAKRTEYKTVDYFERELSRMVTNVYEGNLGGDFIDLLASLIYGQLEQAHNQAWEDEGSGGELPDYLFQSFENMYLAQYDHVDQYYRDIIDARVDETPIAPLLSRASQWARQWDVAHKEALQLIRLNNGGNLMWVKGDTEKGCATCAALDGMVMSAREWEELDVHPRGYPNDKLECEGGGVVNNCDCQLEPTDKRRSPDAYNLVIDIVSK